VLAVKRADTVDGSLNGEVIIDQSVIEQKTQELLSDPGVKVICEGQVSVDGLVARWDALVKKESNQYHLYEVKGCNSVKKDHIHDVFFQYYVYNQFGLNISDISILHLNNSYENSSHPKHFYPMDHSVIMEFFSESTKYKKIQIIDYLNNEYTDLSVVIDELQHLVKLPEPDAKTIYGCRVDGKCTLIDQCHTITKQHLFNLTCDASAGGYYQRVQRMLEAGITQIKDIEMPFLDKYPLITNSEKRSIARMQIEAAKGNIKEKNTILYEPIIEELLKYNVDKLVFFDFESFSYPIPLVTNAQPWEQVPSQYSMHVVDQNYDISLHDFHRSTKTGGIQHFEFIGDPINDQSNSPDLHLLEQLVKHFDEANIDWKTGSYKLIVFNQTYEKGRFKRLGEKYPQYKEFIDNIMDNILDLRHFFINGWLFRTDFGGKTGLKYIQQAFINDLDIQGMYKDVKDFYKNLDYSRGAIKNGSVALEVYQSLLRKVLTTNDVISDYESILDALKYYCKIDTWSTVIIYDLLKRFVQEYQINNSVA